MTPRLFFARPAHVPPPAAGRGSGPGRFNGPMANAFRTQLLNSLVVGGIVFISTLGPGWDLNWVPALKGAGITFLIEMRNYLQRSSE